MKKFLPIFFTFISLCILQGAFSQVVTPFGIPRVPEQALSPDTLLGIDVLNRLKTNQNLAIAPISLWGTLHYIFESSKKTAEELSGLKKALNYGPIVDGNNKLNEYHKQMVNLMNHHEQISLVFFQTGKPKPEFDFYNSIDNYSVALLLQCDINCLNSWVSKSTLGNITEFMRSGVTPAQGMVSAMSFGGDFAAEIFREQSYELFNSRYRVEMITLKGNFQLYSTMQYDAVAVPYKKEHTYAIIIQGKGNTLDNELSAENLKAAIENVLQIQASEESFTMPTFDIHTEKEFSDADLGFEFSKFLKDLDITVNGGTNTAKALHQVRLHTLQNTYKQRTIVPNTNPQAQVSGKKIIIVNKPFYYFVINKPSATVNAHTLVAAYIHEVSSEVGVPKQFLAHNKMESKYQNLASAISAGSSFQQTLQYPFMRQPGQANYPFSSNSPFQQIIPVQQSNLFQQAQGGQQTQQGQQFNLFQQAQGGQQINPFPQSQQINPFPQSQQINPFPQSQQFNQFSQGQQFNPFSQSQQFNPFSQSQQLNPFSQSQQFNQFPQSQQNPWNLNTLQSRPSGNRNPSSNVLLYQVA